MTYRPYQWKKFAQARRRALVHKILNYRKTKSLAVRLDN